MTTTYQTVDLGGNGVPADANAPYCTLATVQANEGTLATVDLSDPASFTFDLPAGLWAQAVIQISVQGYQNGAPFSGDISAAITGSINGTASQSSSGIFQSSYPVAFTFEAFYDAVSYLPGDGGDAAGTVLVQDYPVLSYLEAATTATATLSLIPPGPNSATQESTTLTNVSAVLLLTSIAPTQPYGSLSLVYASASPTPGNFVPPFTGSATAVLPPQPTAAFEGTGNGFQPYSYFWTVTDENGMPPDLLTGQGTASITWVYNYDSYSGQVPPTVNGIDLVTVTCQVTSSPYPHEADTPLSNVLRQVASYYYLVTAIKTAVASKSLAEDAHRRPVIATPHQAAYPGVRGLISNTAGKSYLETDMANTSPYDNPSLLVDRRSNHYRLVCSQRVPGTGTNPGTTNLVLFSGILDDQFTQDAGTQPALISNLAGMYPVAAPHPTHEDYALLVYQDNAQTLRSACSLDAGKTWNTLGTVLSGVDCAKPGRPALGFLGEVAVLVYSNASSLPSLPSSLHALRSLDRGQTWTRLAAPILTYTPNVNLSYYCLSMAEQGGQLYLLAFVGDTQASEQYNAPRLLVSGDAGQTWTLKAAGPVNIYGFQDGEPLETSYTPPGSLPIQMVPPEGIGSSPFSGRLRIGQYYNSDDAGISWLAQS